MMTLSKQVKSKRFDYSLILGDYPRCGCSHTSITDNCYGSTCKVDCDADCDDMIKDDGKCFSELACDLDRLRFWY